MAKRTDWAVNVDKLRVCFTKPENLYAYLNGHYTRYDELTNARILDEDDFSLVFVEDDETKMSAVLNVRDVDGYFRLGIFTFSNSAKYEGKAFFTFENGALYRVYTRVPNGEPTNHICDLLYVADFYGMTFNKTLEDMLVRVGLMAEEERVVKHLYSKHREVGYYESLSLRKYRGTFYYLVYSLIGRERRTLAASDSRGVLRS